MKRALVAGWFSFDGMGATAGDLMSRDVVVRSLRESHLAYDIAVAAPFTDGVNWRAVDPAAYSHLIFVCGPLGRSWDIQQFLNRFEVCRKIAVNVSMMEPLQSWNPFDLILERDSSSEQRPDLAFLSDAALVPVVGVVLIDSQPEYGMRAVHEKVNAEIGAFVARQSVVRVDIDTRLDRNATGLRSSAEVESLVARTDVIVTSRMHGLVLAIKNGIPAVAVDPVLGGAKLRRQAESIGWPHVISAEQLDQSRLLSCFHHCLGEDSRAMARECAARARKALAEVQSALAHEWEKARRE